MTNEPEHFARLKRQQSPHEEHDDSGLFWRPKLKKDRDPERWLRLEQVLAIGAIVWVTALVFFIL